MVTLRNWVYSRLSTSSGVSAIVADRIFPTNAFGDSNVQTARPFIIYNMGLSTVVHGVSTLPVQVWAHDDQGGMETIDLLLKASRAALDGLHAIKLEGGEYIYECAWEGDSGDLYDDMLRTGTKFGSYRVVART